LIRAASLEELLDENRSWVELETKIANATLNFSGNVDLAEITRNLKLKLAFKGEGLENFNRLLGVDLPPVPSYGLNASLSAMPGKVELTDLQIRVSSSKLTGSMKIDNTRSIPSVDIELNSPLFQLNDFVFEDWSLIRDDDEEQESKEDKKTKEIDDTEKVTAAPVSAEKTLELLSPEILQQYNVSLTVTADKVQSGEEQLGSGKIAASLKDGRISLDPLNLAVPGGSLSMGMSLRPGRESADASLRVLVENFDFGILARRSNPQTDMGGFINIDIDLTSTANDFAGLLENGNGYFDFSAKPENLEAGIMDLWAINLITSIVTSAVKEKSHIECLVGRWTMEDGLLEPDILVIDTSRIRICGKGEINFNTNRLNLEVAPVPKKPEFFSLATPISVQGEFTDFGMGIAAGGLPMTGIKFVINPIEVPLRTVFSKPIPSDGSDVCNIEIGPENRKVSKPAGCR
jgi:uncharacterized protein involved in outer membrane biogenesis